LQTSLTLRQRAGFTSTIDYAWSHSIDNASGGQDYVANAAQPDNSFRTGLERANSNFDVRHRFVATFSYELPNFMKSHRRIGDGWQPKGILTLRSGSLFHVSLFDDYNGTGEFFPRPDLVGDPYAGTGWPENFLNLSAFAVPYTLDPAGAGSAAPCIPGTRTASAAWAATPCAARATATSLSPFSRRRPSRSASRSSSARRSSTSSTTRTSPRRCSRASRPTRASTA
jgi:hypothetical protein